MIRTLDKAVLENFWSINCAIFIPELKRKVKSPH